MMSDETMGAHERWLTIYEQSGEMPPAGVLRTQLRSADAEIARLNAVIEADKGRRGNTARRYDKRIADLEDALQQARAERDALREALEDIASGSPLSSHMQIAKAHEARAREALTSMERGQA